MAQAQTPTITFSVDTSGAVAALDALRCEQSRLARLVAESAAIASRLERELCEVECSDLASKRVGPLVYAARAAHAMLGTWASATEAQLASRVAQCIESIAVTGAETASSCER